MSDDNARFSKLTELVSNQRLRVSTRGEISTLIATESDKGRVINSAAFRRLQQKAQVFPLDPNAAVRTRLTHSIEVSQIGRYLAQKIIQGLKATELPYSNLCAFVNTVETACLLHDIGNPPFGHFGESAIKKWAKTNKLSKDLREYDGNPQGFRLMSFLNGTDTYGLNLTCTLLLSVLKYPWTYEAKPSNAKKVGIFTHDEPAYIESCEKINWHVGKKFPFARLMETADDIAYSMSDLEDGLEKNIISIRDLEDEFGSSLFTRDGSIDPFVKFKTNAINDAVEEASKQFINNLEAILDGEDIPILGKDSDAGGLIGSIKLYAKRKIYSDESAESIELAGKSVIEGLLKHFMSLIDLHEDKFLCVFNQNQGEIKEHELDYEVRLLRRLPQSYRDKYFQSNTNEERDKRAHLIVDFVSGMTDHFALQTYQTLEGIRIK